LKLKTPAGSKIKKKHTGSGYITKKYLVASETYNYFWSLTDSIEFTVETSEKTKAIRKKNHRLKTYSEESRALFFRSEMEFP
jgi:hypothetical protein